MRTVLLTIAMLLSVASPVSAKLGVQIALVVEHDQDGTLEKTLKDGMEARLNSTERYTVTNDSHALDLLIEVGCIAIQNNGIKTGIITCFSVVNYLPYRGSVLLANQLEQAGSIYVSGSGTAYIAEQMMNDFINGTTDAKLKEQKGILRMGIQVLCQDHPEECGILAKK